jgi:DNA-binding LacI/PurR family transcriptional regulator
MSHRDAAKPLYQKIFERLSHEIASGRYSPGEKLPSEAALVQRLGASRITVGRAVRELQQRGLVERISGSGTYITQPSLSSKSGLLFGLIIPNLGETEIFEPICQGIAAAPDAKGFGLLWPHAGADAPTREEQALQLCRQSIDRGVSGAFFAPLELSPASGEVNRCILKMLKDASIPVVLLDRRPEETSARERCDLVGIDNYRAGFLAADHLLTLGATQIGFLAYQHQATTVKVRIEGYRAALEAKRHQLNVFHVPGSSRLVLPPEARRCDAFVCANDRIAGHLMHALLAQRIRIPQDVRIVGIDDVNYAALLSVPLTTVHQPCRDIGEVALRMMLERLDHPRMPARDVLLDCELVIRESCGAHAYASS